MRKIGKLLTIVFAAFFVFSACGRNDQNAPLDLNAPFFFSEELNDNGHWKGIKAGNYIEDFNYKGINIPYEINNVSEEDLQIATAQLLSNYMLRDEITDRPVEDGDLVNIDFVGSIDGVEFEGGNTEGMGYEVTAGTTQFIDDFLFQIIGAMPGETMNIEVTFPEDYGSEELAGKDALFVTTINYIIHTYPPELTDAFVAENFFAQYGWQTADEILAEMRKNIRMAAINDYLWDYLTTEVTFKSVPSRIINYQKRSAVDHYNYIAESYQVPLNDVLIEMLGVYSIEEALAKEDENIIKGAKYSLVLQAIAEGEKIEVTDEDMTEYFTNYEGISDYTTLIDTYGIGYLRQIVLQHLVIQYIADNAAVG